MSHAEHQIISCRFLLLFFSPTLPPSFTALCHDAVIVGYSHKGHCMLLFGTLVSNDYITN